MMLTLFQKIIIGVLSILSILVVHNLVKVIQKNKKGPRGSPGLKGLTGPSGVPYEPKPLNTHKSEYTYELFSKKHYDFYLSFNNNKKVIKRNKFKVLQEIKFSWQQTKSNKVFEFENENTIFRVDIYSLLINYMDRIQNDNKEIIEVINSIDTNTLDKYLVNKKNMNFEQYIIDEYKKTYI